MITTNLVAITIYFALVSLIVYTIKANKREGINMSQNFKVEKQKNKFDWSKIYQYIRCLWSNEAVLNTGLKTKWYIAVIIGLLSIIFSVIPLTVHSATSSGSKFVDTTYIYNYDEGFYSFLEDANSKGYTINFDKANASSKLTGTTTSSTNNYLLYEHSDTALDKHTTSKVDFQVYYFPEGVDFSTTQATINALGANSTSGRDVSYIIFGTKYFASALYKPGSYTSVGGVNGDYANLTSEFTSLNSFLVTNKTTRNDNATASLALLKTFMNEVYLNNRVLYTWMQVGVILAVNSSITLLMGLVLFLMTRGKNNPNNYIKFQQCFNMGYLAAMAPALLGLILGFIFSGYEIMLYVIIYGFRIMWLSMKALSPAAGPSK